MNAIGKRTASFKMWILLLGVTVAVPAWKADKVNAQTGSLVPVKYQKAAVGPVSAKPASSARGLLVKGSLSKLWTSRSASPVSQPRYVSPPATKIDPPMVDKQVTPASCSSCGSGLLGSRGLSIGGCGAGGCGGGWCPGHGDLGEIGCPSTNCGSCCYPGNLHCCSWCDSGGPVKKLCCGLYHCICCPDPCYEPRWIAVANASFFVDDARPISHTRLRYDGMFNMDRPDRAEYFFKKFDKENVPAQAEINEFRMYTETATGGFAFFIEFPWRDASFDLTDPKLASLDATGFGDMNLGTKSVLLDCELLLVTLQFTTYIPTGAGVLGTGHTSLEPALLFALKLSPDFYAQFESAYWIPISGSADIAGNVWHNRLSLNRVLYRFLPDVELIGSLEFINWNVLSGGYSVQGQDAANRGRDAFLNIGPGLRLNICDKIDVGVGSHFSVLDDDFVGQAVRAEFRWRF